MCLTDSESWSLNIVRGQGLYGLIAFSIPVKLYSDLICGVSCHDVIIVS
jgi:hypothetical protein